MDKNGVRKRIRSLRSSLTQEQVDRNSLFVFEQFCTLAQIQDANCLALYLSDENEISTRLMLDWLAQCNKTTCLPVVDDRNLLFYEYCPSRLVENHLAILEPDRASSLLLDLQSIDAIIVPLVAYDINRYRLGRGGGYYDRALQGVRKMSAPPFLIGLGYDMQKIDDCMPEPHDVQMDCIITPSCIIK